MASQLNTCQNFSTVSAISCSLHLQCEVKSRDHWEEKEWTHTNFFWAFTSLNMYLLNLWLLSLIHLKYPVCTILGSVLPLRFWDYLGENPNLLSSLAKSQTAFCWEVGWMRRGGGAERSCIGWHPGWIVGDRNCPECLRLLRTLPTKPLHEPPSLFGVCTAAAEITRLFKSPLEKKRLLSWALLGLSSSRILFSSVLAFPRHARASQSDGARLGKTGMLGRRFPVSYERRAGVADPSCPRCSFSLLPLPWRGGARLCALCGPVSACWHLSLSFPLTRGMYLFARGAFESRVRSHKPLGSWSFN